MKKIFFMAVSAVLLAAGCQKTEIQNEVLPQIGFKTQMGKLTKAPDAGNAERYANLNEQGFMVWGYFNADNDLNYEKGDLYLGNEDGKTGIKVTAAENGRDDEAGTATTWTTTETYYWPGKGKSLDLYCVSLYDGGVTPSNTYAKVTPVYAAKTLTVTDFVVDASADNDLMVAPLITQDQDTKTFVEPAFTHALTKVLVNFKTISAKSEIYVISAKTSELPNTGTLTVNNASEETDFLKKLSWTNLTGATEYEDEYVFKAPVEGTIIDLPSTFNNSVNAVRLTGETVQFASWLLLPQENLTATLDVEYIVDGMYIKQTFNLATSNVKSWGKNVQTTYNVTISSDYIEFAPVVEEWVDGGEGAFGE